MCTGGGQRQILTESRLHGQLELDRRVFEDALRLVKQLLDVALGPLQHRG